MKKYLLLLLFMPFVASANGIINVSEWAGYKICYANQLYTEGSQTRCKTGQGMLDAQNLTALNFINANIAQPPSQNRAYQMHQIVQQGGMQFHWDVVWYYNWNAQTQQGTWQFVERIERGEGEHGSCEHVN